MLTHFFKDDQEQILAFSGFFITALLIIFKDIDVNNTKQKNE